MPRSRHASRARPSVPGRGREGHGGPGSFRPAESAAGAFEPTENDTGRAVNIVVKRPQAGPARVARARGQEVGRPGSGKRDGVTRRLVKRLVKRRVKRLIQLLVKRLVKRRVK
jgi:hypothetical protein